MQIESGTFCPFIKKDCIGLKCNLFIKVKGTNPQTGQEIDEWDCTLKWLPMLLNTQQVRQGSAATESFRNEMVKSAEATIHTMVAIANHQTEMPMRLVDSRTEDNNDVNQN